MPFPTIFGDDNSNHPVFEWVNSDNSQDDMTQEYLSEGVAITTDAGSREADLIDLIEHSQDAIWSIDTCYRAVVFNSNFKQQFLSVCGIEPTQGMNLITWLPLDLQNQWAEYYDRALRGDRFIVRAQSGLINSDTEMSFSPILSNDGKPKGVAVFAQAVRHREIIAAKRHEVVCHQFEQELRESQERYALAVQGANDGLWDWNLKTNEIYFSARWKSMLGYKEVEIGSSTSEWFSRIHPEELDWFQAKLAAHLEGQTLHFEIEHRICHKDGRYRWMLSRGLAVRDQNQKFCRMAGSQTDITERKRAEEQLLHDALHDGLTGFSNRALFVDRLKQAIERTKRHPGDRFAVLFLDLDRFKVVNDSLGHSVGDQLLVAIARRLEPCVEVGNTIARLGGDEFTILLEGIKDLSDATRLAELIHLKLHAPFNVEGQEVFTTVSIGIALSETGGDSLLTHAEDLLRNAHTAMYRAKALGRARHELFDRTMRDRAVILLQLETDLRRALIGGKAATLLQEFQLYYQPVISLKTGRISGFEALVRWLHPERGLISPAEFIPLAEDTGLIVPLGQWILTKACQQLRMWQQQFPHRFSLSISINLSTKQLAQTDLIEQVQQILCQTTMAGDNLNLKLEITESAIMANPDTSTALLNQLKSLGVKLLIDDFGTGYSSLSYLHRFPFDTVKIDQSFISRMNSHDESSEIVRTIVMLAHNLGMNAVAEGIETIEQMMKLRALGVEYGQGYFFAKPLTDTAVEQLLASESDLIDAKPINHSSGDCNCLY